MRLALHPILLTIAACVVAIPGFTATPDRPLDRHDPETALAVSQDAIGNTLSDVTLYDVHGQPFHLRRLVGKPLIVSLIYTSCHHVCPMITRNLARNVEIAQEALGENAFNIVTIGFDWAADSPDRMRMFAATHGINQSNWFFLSGDDSTITTVTGDVGFQFVASAKGFDHLSQTTIVDRNGRVYRQVYGQIPDPTAIVEPLKELVFDTPADAGFVAHWVDTFKLFCTVFDPNSGRYRFDYSIAMTVLTGILSLGAVGWFILHEWRRPR